jgi:twitching motility protein PilT
MTVRTAIEFASAFQDDQPLPRTKDLIETLLNSEDSVSDIFLSPMRRPEVRANGRIVSTKMGELPVLLPDDTRRIASDLIGTRAIISRRLDAEGACDFSIFLPIGRFRVNIFSQRGSYAITLRVISDPFLPSYQSLHLPAPLERLVRLRSGLVIVSGPSGSGKSSTLAAVLNRINEEREIHIVTIEDPIEFQFRHQRATVLQREIHRDVASFPKALRTTLRHPPHVVMLSAIPDRETLDLTLEAADCGHVVFAAVHTSDASRTIDHLLRFFSPAQELSTRARLARSIRAIVSQRLLPRKDGSGQAALYEILFSAPRIRECIAHGEDRVISLTEAIQQGAQEGMQTFQQELDRLHKAGVIAEDVGWDELFGDQIPPLTKPDDDAFSNGPVSPARSETGFTPARS